MGSLIDFFAPVFGVGFVVSFVVSFALSRMHRKWREDHGEAERKQREAERAEWDRANLPYNEWDAAVLRWHESETYRNYQAQRDE